MSFPPPLLLVLVWRGESGRSGRAIPACSLAIALGTTGAATCLGNIVELTLMRKAWVSHSRGYESRTVSALQKLQQHL